MSVLRKILKNKSVINKNIYNYVININRCSSTQNGKILKSDIEDIEIKKITVPEFVFENLHKWPNHTALECAVSGRKYTYSEFQKKSKNLGKSLRKRLKLQNGDVVAILLPNVPEFIIAAIGALQSGLIVTTLNPLYTPHEISSQLLNSSAKAIITLDVLWKLASASAQMTQLSLPILSIQSQMDQATPEGAISFAEFTDNEVDIPDFAPVDPESIAFLPYSSGTTGLPKGVQLSHTNIVSNLHQIKHPVFDIIKVTTSDHQDSVPVVLPQFHIYGLTANTLHVIRNGGKLITLPKFTPELYISTLKKHKPDVLFVVPPIILFLTAHPAITTDDLACVRTVMSGAAPLGALDEERLVQKAKKDMNVLQGFGLTETSPAVSMTPHAMKGMQGSVGRLIPNTLAKVVDINDTEGKPLGPNTPGELYVKGPQVMKGYLNKPKETEETFHDGWLKTGDVFYYKEDGSLFVKDRIKELIKVRGFQVPPAELEEIIRDFPEVSDAAVIGIPHEKDGEVPRAYVIPKPGATIDSQKLAEFVNSKVAHYKHVKGGVVIVDNIPKSASGKIMRREIKENYQKNGK